MNTNTLNLLVWENELERYEQHLNILRNLGFAIREQQINNSEGLQTTLHEKKCDLLICDEPSLDQSALTLQQLINQQQPNLICIYLYTEKDKDALYELYEAGASLVINREQIDLLKVQLPRLIDCHSLQEQLQDAKQKIAEGEQRNRTLMDSSRDAIAYIQDGMHAYTNLSYIEMFGISEQDELECTPLLDLITKDFRDEVKNIFRQFARKELTHTTLDCTALKQEQPLKVNISFAEALLDGEPSIQLVIHDQSYDEELTQKLAELSSKDLVTDLANRRHFIAQLKEFVEAEDTDQPPHAVIFIKIDNYPELQHQLGIAGCDILLRDITEIIQPILSRSKSLARFADDIFTSLHPMTDEIKIHTLCQEICDVIANSELNIDDKQMNTTFSIGLSQLDGQQRSAEKILVEVERACNNAHQTGGNRVQELHSLESADTPQNIGSEELIKQALKQNNFLLVFQPIVSLHASPGERYQVLIRMQNDNGEEISPGNFLPAAEKAGLMQMIDRWVIVNSINALIKQRQQGKKLQLFIKLSKASLLDPETIKWIGKYLHESRMPGDNLVFELNQEHILEHPKESEAFIEMVGQLHCLTAVDHVLGLLETIDYLARLNADFLKIDGSLISSLVSDKSAQEITKKITGLAQANNKQTIAEFVHDANTLAILWQHGVNFVQGYYLQQPDHEMSYNFDD